MRARGDTGARQGGAGAGAVGSLMQRAAGQAGRATQGAARGAMAAGLAAVAAAAAGALRAKRAASAGAGFGFGGASLRTAAGGLGQRAPLAAAPLAAVGPKGSNVAGAAAAEQQQAAAGAAADQALAERLGFEVVEEQFIEEYDSLCTLYRHGPTGAEVMSVVNSDENKTFGTVLRTPPDNSSGIPHILEHSVLCGSRKYPIKEPFVELMKSSLNTFLNAFTYPDRTCYPVASTNLQDYYNLVDVYLDAVYHPKCVNEPMTFEQEGWHYEIDAPEAEMTYKGVVYNEMKGVYSNPDSVLGRITQQRLFPDNTYGVDSGGTPEFIPDLTFEEFKNFHSDFYHPSNSRFWFYGDDDPNKRLEILSAFLADFEANPDGVSKSRIGTQKLFTEPKRVTGEYAAGETTGDKGYCTVSWVLNEDVFDVETSLAFGFLDYLMLGTRAAPLFKTMTESGLGEAVTGGGLEDELRQPTFGIGLKGVSQENIAKVEPLVLATLEKMAEEGFSEGQIEAAINTIEFSLRENNTGSFPRGLSLMLRSMANWLYDKDPFQPLKWQKDLDKFKARLASGEDVFGDLIRKYLLNNPHRVTIELLPNKDLGAEQDAKEASRLAAVKADMTEEEISAMVNATKQLKLHQETPDPPEALKCVPALSVADLPKESASIPSEKVALGDTTVLKHDIFTNNVVYASVALPMSGVPARLLPLVPLFCRCLTQMGTATESFVELTERIGRKTGGIGASSVVSSKRGSDDAVAYLTVGGKAMADQMGDFFAIAKDILTTTDFDDSEKFYQMVLETKSGQESGIVGAGHSYAARRLSAQRTVAGWVNEQMGGYANMEYTRALEKRVKEDWASVLADLKELQGLVLHRKGSIVNLTGAEATLNAAVEGPVADFLGCLTEGVAPQASWEIAEAPADEALLVPTQVNYVGKAANLYKDAGYELHGSAYVISKYLGNTHLWDSVRVVGGAYGGFCSFDSHSGMFTYLSYRDPNLQGTLDNYDATVDFLRNLELDDDALNKAIIASIGDIDAYQLPDAKGNTAFSREILGVTDEERQKRREEILGTTVEDFHRFADVLEAVRGDAARVVAVASESAAEKANEAGAGLAIKKVL